MIRKLMLRRSMLLTGLGATLPPPVHAKHGWPSRPIRLIVPYPPGGAAGLWARMVATGIGDALGEGVLVEHRGAAGGLAGTEAVARASPDGHTMLFTTSAHVTAPLALARSPYDPLNDFAAVGRIGSAPLVLVASTAFQGTTLRDLQNSLSPDGATFGSPGVCSRGHAFGVILAEALGVAAEHAPYAGEAPMIADLRNGGLSFGFCSPAAVRGGSGDRSLRVLAATGSTRMPAMANVPLLLEEGYSGEFAIGGFIGILMPTQTPRSILDRIAGVLYALMSDRRFRERLASAYLLPDWLGPADFHDHLSRFSRQWELVIRRRHLQS